MLLGLCVVLCGGEGGEGLLVRGHCGSEMVWGEWMWVFVLIALVWCLAAMCSSNDIGAEGAAALGGALASMTSLQTLDLGCVCVFVWMVVVVLCDGGCCDVGCDGRGCG